MMIKALLLDLDNTLLDINFDGFMQEYIQRIAKRFANTVPAEELQKQLLASTRAMVENADPERTVLQAFIDDFFPALQLPLSAVDVFMDFYHTEFAELQHWGRPMPYARQLVEAAFARDLVVVIATAPLFPKEAIRERLRWAEVDNYGYRFITSADIMHFSKPSPNYYREIAERIDISPDACLMIGDELLMDGPAARAGMHVALVGPERPSNTVRWLSGMSGDVGSKELERYPSIEALMERLRLDGVL